MARMMDTSYHQYLIDGQRVGMRYALAATRRSPLGLIGMQLGRRAGASLEFKDHREYQPGDDLRHIDWSAYARSDKLTVKLHHEEVNPHLDLLLDGSLSMSLADTAKAQAALGLAAVLTTAADNSSFTHAMYLARAVCTLVENGSDAPSAWAGMMLDHAGSLAETLHRHPPRWRPHGIRVLVSDLLFEAEPMTILQPLAHQAAAVFIVQVLARTDVDPPQRGNVRLVDCETHQLKEVFVDAVAQQRYRDNLSRHLGHWNSAARSVGASMVTLVAEDVVDDWNLSELVRAELLQMV